MHVEQMFVSDGGIGDATSDIRPLFDQRNAKVGALEQLISQQSAAGAAPDDDRAARGGCAHANGLPIVGSAGSWNVVLFGTSKRGK
jgi:hypothetical protein